MINLGLLGPDFQYRVTPATLNTAFQQVLLPNATRFALAVCMQSNAQLTYLAEQFTVAAGVTIWVLSPGSPSAILTFRDWGPIIGGGWQGAATAAATSTIWTEVLYSPITGSEPSFLATPLEETDIWSVISRLASNLSQLVQARSNSQVADRIAGR